MVNAKQAKRLSDAFIRRASLPKIDTIDVKKSAFDSDPYIGQQIRYDGGGQAALLFVSAEPIDLGEAWRLKVDVHPYDPAVYSWETAEDQAAIPLT